MAFGVKQRNKEGQNNTKPTRFFSKKQEDKVAKTIGGKTTANSGATMFGGKGDILTSGKNNDGKGSFLIECKTKTTHSNSISIKKEWIEKNRQEMVFEGKEHQAIVFNFGPDEENHYIIDEYLFLELLDYLSNKSE